MKAEPPAFLKIALNVIRELRDKLLIYAMPGLKVETQLKARILINTETTLRPCRQ
jgi:hypothetical protein